MYLSKKEILLSKGFTTIELLVVMALMLVVISASVNIFLLTSRTQKKIISNQQVQSDMRYALETMVRDIHVSAIDYDYYESNIPALPLIDGSVVEPMAILALRDSSNQSALYRLNTANNSLELSRDSGATWHPLLSNNVQVSSLVFYIVPASDPFILCGSGGVDCSAVPNEQPRVTIALTAQNVPDPGYPVTAIWLQTTILTRSYRR